MVVRNIPHVKALGSVNCGHPLHGAEDTEMGLVTLNSLIPFSFSFASRSMGLREVSLLLWAPCTGGTESSEWLQHPTCWSDRNCGLAFYSLAF